MKEMIESVKRDVNVLTGLKVNAVTGTTKDEETGFWNVEVELLERTGIPDTMDMLGIYEVSVDENGDVLEFVRKGLRKRGDKDITMVEEY